MRALTEIEQFNEYFNAELSDEDADTLGGLVTSELARMPRRGDVVVIDRFEIEVQRADARQVHVLMVRVMSDEEMERRREKAENADDA